MSSPMDVDFPRCPSIAQHPAKTLHVHAVQGATHVKTAMSACPGDFHQGLFSQRFSELRSR